MLPFKSFIQLDERVLIAKDMDMTLGHGNARVQLKHPTENRVMTNSEVMNEIPSQHLDSSLHQERTSSPHSPFRFTDQELYVPDPICFSLAKTRAPVPEL